MYLGGDLSYVNEIEASGGVYFDKGQPKDPFVILRDYGANIVRVRLWHTPTVTQYSTLADVQRTIARAKALDMAVLLDFHYSDWWADPAKQVIPAAWSQITDLQGLERALYDYTLNVLVELDQHHLMPELVQVGNEINTELLMPAPYVDGAVINWQRNVRLINAGIKAVRDAGQQTSTSPRVMLHIAQPENVMPWFDAALAAGTADFDVIGVSYYPKWSIHSIEQAGQMLGEIRKRYNKEVMIVETAYPWTQSAGLAETHLLAEDAVLPDYPATPQGQRQFLIDLTQATVKNGGTGVIYWEPAWISTPQKPSIWENAALFDYRNAAHEGIEFLSQTMYAQK
jgi:arabinogalactan endo-1,4-beta-galactosidase